VLETPLLAELFEISHLVAPTDGRLTRDWRLPASALVVVDQLSAWGQRIKTGEEIVVVRARAAVQNHGRRAAPDPALEQIYSPHFAGAGLSLWHPSLPHPARDLLNESRGALPK
jgi:hypothetical protein